VPDETARPIGLRDNDERGALRHEQREPLGGGPRDQHGKAGRRVAIRPVFPADGGFLYAIATAPETAYKWRFRGSSPSPEQFSGQLWAAGRPQSQVLRALTWEGARYWRVLPPSC